VNVELLVTDDCGPCEKAERLWRDLCQRHGLAFRVRAIGGAEHAETRYGRRLGSVPALLIDGRVVAVGVPSRAEAEALLRARRPGPGTGVDDR